MTHKDVVKFIQHNLVHIHRDSGEIEYTDCNGCNIVIGFCDDVYEAINRAIVSERKKIEIIY